MSRPVATGPIQWSHAHRPTSEMVDAALLEEIELLADVIAATAAYPGHLTPEQVDTLLDVPSSPADKPRCNVVSRWQ